MALKGLALLLCALFRAFALLFSSLFAKNVRGLTLRIDNPYASAPFDGS
jgi:hypothetical protein